MLKVLPAISTVSSVSGGFRGLALMERGRGHTGQLFVVYVNVVVCKIENIFSDYFSFCLSHDERFLQLFDKIFYQFHNK